jgi:hypothetical protein
MLLLKKWLDYSSNFHPSYVNNPKDSLWYYSGNFTAPIVSIYRCTIQIEQKVIPFKSFCIKYIYESLPLKFVFPISFVK